MEKLQHKFWALLGKIGFQTPIDYSFSYEVMDDEGNSVSEERHETYEKAQEISDALTELTGDRHSVKILGVVEAR